MSRSALRPSMPFPSPSCDESEVASIHSITDQLLVTALPARKFVSKPEATASGPSSTSANPLPPKVPTSSSTNPPLSHPPPSANPPCDDTTDDDARVEDELLFRQHLAYLRSRGVFTCQQHRERLGRIVLLGRVVSIILGRRRQVDGRTRRSR